MSLTTKGVGVVLMRGNVIHTFDSSDDMQRFIAEKPKGDLIVGAWADMHVHHAKPRESHGVNPVVTPSDWDLFEAEQ